MEEHENQLTVAIVDDDESVLDAVKLVLEDIDALIEMAGLNDYYGGENTLGNAGLSLTVAHEKSAIRH